MNVLEGPYAELSNFFIGPQLLRGGEGAVGAGTARRLDLMVLLADRFTFTLAGASSVGRAARE